MLNLVYNVRRAPVGCIYIGRQCGKFPETPYGNPFRIGKDGNRDEVILKFIEYWYAPEQKWLRELAIRELTGKPLMCWCFPSRCHGDIIVGYLQWKTGFLRAA
jgi:Domain of unknown function (DUF4326)